LSKLCREAGREQQETDKMHARVRRRDRSGATAAVNPNGRSLASFAFRFGKGNVCGVEHRTGRDSLVFEPTDLDNLFARVADTTAD